MFLYFAEEIGIRKQGHTLFMIFVKISSNRKNYFKSVLSCHFILLSWENRKQVTEEAYIFQSTDSNLKFIKEC